MVPSPWKDLRGNRSGIPPKSIYAKWPTRDSSPDGKVRNYGPLNPSLPIIKQPGRIQRINNPGVERVGECRELGREGVESLPKGFAPVGGMGAEMGELERREFREMPRKQGPETRTGRRFEASACSYNPRVKQSLMPLIQLREQNSVRTASETR